MTPARRNGLAILIVLLLGAGVASVFLVDEDDGTGQSATGAAQTSTTVTTPPATVADPASPESTTTSVAPATTTTTAVGRATTTTALTRQPRTGGPTTVPAGAALAALGVVVLVLARTVELRPRSHRD